MARIEREETGATREARYATASRALMVQGQSRAAAARTLGITTSALERVLRENRDDVRLTTDDPIVTGSLHRPPREQQFALDGKGRHASTHPNSDLTARSSALRSARRSSTISRG